MNFQQCPQTLQFQRYGRAARHSVGGIACDIRGKLAGRESCATTHSTAGSAATDAAGSTAGSAAGSTASSAATSAPVARQRPDTVDTVAANDLPKPHRDRSRDHAQTRNETTTSTPTFPHQHTKKSPQNQHVLSFNPEATRRATLAARATSGRGLSVTNVVLKFRV